MSATGAAGLSTDGWKSTPRTRVGVEGDLARAFDGARGAERAEVDALRVERHRARAAVPADLVDEPRLIGGEAVGHFLGEPLDRAGREHVRRVAFDELADERRCGTDRGGR